MGVMPGTSSEAPAGTLGQERPPSGARRRRTAPRSGLEQDPSHDAHHDRGHGDATTELQEAAPIPVRHRRGWVEGWRREAALVVAGPRGRVSGQHHPERQRGPRRWPR